jgi:predicted transcriptional regulator
MSPRRLNIGIRSAGARTRALRDALRAAARGKNMVREPELYFENIEELRRILTEKRLGLLVAIARQRPGSIHELAGIVGRDYKNVSNDVTMLQRLGLVSVGKPGGKGRAQVPTVPYDEIHVTIDLRRDDEVHAN